MQFRVSQSLADSFRKNMIFGRIGQYDIWTDTYNLVL